MRFLHISLLLLSIFLYTTDGYAKTVFRVAYGDKETVPYYNGDGPTVPHERPGLVIELINLIATDLDMRVEYQRMPWSDVLKALEANQVDAIFDASFVPARQKIGRYPMRGSKPDLTKALYKRNYSLFITDPKAVHWDGVDLYSDGRAIGAKKNFSIIRDLETRRVTAESVVGRDVGYNLVKSGTLAGFADLEIEGTNFLEKRLDEFKMIKKIRRPLKSKHYYLMLSHDFYGKYPSLSEKIWSLIPEILNSSTMRHIRATY